MADDTVPVNDTPPVATEQKLADITLTFTDSEQRMFLSLLNNLLRSSGLDGFNMTSHFLMKLNAAQKIAGVARSMMEKTDKSKRTK